jgi:capsular exopolysaccharide synthesis family protein
MDKQYKPQFSRKNNSSSALPAVVSPDPAALVARNHYVINGSYNGAPPPVRDEDDEEKGILEYWRILARYKGTVIGASLVGLILGFAVCVPMKPVFRAATTLEVLTINGDFMNQKQSNPTTTADGNYDTSEEQTQSKLLQSSALIKRVIAKLNPTGSDALSRPVLASTGWRGWLHLPEPVTSSSKTILLQKAAASLSVRPDPRTRLLQVSVDSTDPKLAADFANTLTQEFIAQNVEASWATTQNTSEWLRRELEDARKKLIDSENSLQSYATTSGLIFTDETTNVATEKLQQLQQSLSAATAERIAKQSRYELAQSAPPDSLGDVLNDTGLRSTLAKLNDLKGQLAEAGTVFAPESTKVQRLQAELGSVQSDFDHQRTDIITRIKNDFTESNRKEKLLSAAYDSQAHEVTGQDEKAIQYNILKRDVDSNRQLYDTMLQQMKQASIASAIHAGNVRVVDPADVPNNPFSPNFKLNSLLGMLTGLVLSIGFVSMRERADRTLQQPGDIKLWTEVIELGVIPNASLGAKSQQYYRPLATGQERRRARAHTSLSLPEPAELITAGQQPTMSAEAFRSTLTSMLFVSDEADRPKVLVFTSANAADGKTTVVSNLAIAAAEIRMKVLVIDADLRRPRMHDVFNVSNDQGLVDILTGEVTENGLSLLIQETGIKNLYILPAGPPTQAAAHLLYSPMWESLLDGLREEYDMIFVDTPPMLQMTDARVAARMADAVVLVARSNVTTRDVIMAAKDRLTEDRIPILGAILNDWNPKHSPGGYYGYYKSHYYHANHYSNG